MHNKYIYIYHLVVVKICVHLETVYGGVDDLGRVFSVFSAQMVVSNFGSGACH